MGFSVFQCFEYTFQCDECDDMVVYHTGDADNEIEYIHDSESARKASKYHRTKGKWICDECWKNRRADA